MDDGCGKKTTEDHGKKKDENNNMEYEYTDTYVYDVTNGDELTTKIGYDKYNNWNCRNYRNRIKEMDLEFICIKLMNRILIRNLIMNLI